MNYKEYILKDFGDERGALIPLEGGNNVPFEIKRTFYIYNTKPSAPRGAHANRNSEFLMVVLSGSCKVMITDGTNKEIIELNRPNQALYIDKMLWKEMYDFSYNAILLVLSNEKYNENEYIRNYDEYLNIMKGN